MTEKTVYGVIGPTAAGKSALALQAAEALGGQIICMDSMQVYRGMDIGTAKPDAEERRRVPHHLLDIRDPGEGFTVSDWVAEAERIISRVDVPILVGGTGLYLQALMQGSALGGVEGDEALRDRYRAYAAEHGAQALHDLLREKDPSSAERLHPHDVRRVIRALEVAEKTGKPMEARFSFSGEGSPYRFVLAAPCPERPLLYAAINKRVDDMMKKGLLEEVRALYDAGIDEKSQAIQGLGYKELYLYFRGELPLDRAVDLIRTRTRHYAKRQITFFRRFENCVWLTDADPDANLKKAMAVFRGASAGGVTD